MAADPTCGWKSAKLRQVRLSPQPRPNLMKKNTVACETWDDPAPHGLGLATLWATVRLFPDTWIPNEYGLSAARGPAKVPSSPQSEQPPPRTPWIENSGTSSRKPWSADHWRRWVWGGPALSRRGEADAVEGVSRQIFPCYYRALVHRVRSLNGPTK